MIRRIAAFMLSRTHAGSADRSWSFAKKGGRNSENPISDDRLSTSRWSDCGDQGSGRISPRRRCKQSAAVERLRARKHRVEKPFAVMVPDIATAERFCEIDEVSRRLLLSPQRPIVLLKKRRGSTIADAVAPGNRDLGIFLPYTPLHHLMFAGGHFSALVMTSANLSEEPICIDNDEAIRRLEGIADCFLLHNREILIRSDDSVLRVVDGRARQMRRSRGFVPMPVFVDRELPSILAVGGELKNTICYTRANTAFLSQHVGDLENVESYGFFGETVKHLGQILEIEPEAHRVRPAPGVFFNAMGAEADRSEACRCAASSRAHRQLHGGEPS